MARRGLTDRERLRPAPLLPRQRTGRPALRLELADQLDRVEVGLGGGLPGAGALQLPGRSDELAYAGRFGLSSGNSVAIAIACAAAALVA